MGPFRSRAASRSGTAFASGRNVSISRGSVTFSESEEEKVVVVNAPYLEQHVPFVRDRLKRAGIRLAHLLNTTVGQ